MHSIKARVKGGRVDLPVPRDWRDGTQVIVQPIAIDAAFGIPESDWPETATAAADWVQWYDSLEPLIFKTEERANWDAARREREQIEKGTFAERAEKLRRAWE